MNWAVLIWTGLMVVFLIVEAACPIHLVSIWFAAGALIAAIVSSLGGQLWLQILVFLAVSGALLALLWPVVKKLLKPKLVKTNVDAVIGTTGIVTEQIDNVAAAGHVSLAAMDWTARSTDGSVIPKGTIVKVDRIEGVKAYVTLIGEPVRTK